MSRYEDSYELGLWASLAWRCDRRYRWDRIVSKVNWQRVMEARGDEDPDIEWLSNLWLIKRDRCFRRYVVTRRKTMIMMKGRA